MNNYQKTVYFRDFFPLNTVLIMGIFCSSYWLAGGHMTQRIRAGLDHGSQVLQLIPGLQNPAFSSVVLQQHFLFFSHLARISVMHSTKKKNSANNL